MKQGSDLFSKSPCPSYPLKLSPQEYSSPSVVKAKQLSAPQATWSNYIVYPTAFTAPDIPLLGTAIL